MSEPIKLYIKETAVSGAENDFTLDLLEHDNNTLYEESSGPTVALGEGSYEFEIKVYLESPGGDVEYMHTIIVSQDESDEMVRPGGLPGTNSVLSRARNATVDAKGTDPVTQDESDETARPGDLPGKQGIF